MENEHDYLPWSVFLGRIKYFNNILDSTELYGDLKKYFTSLVKNVYNKLGGSNTEEWTDKVIRPLIIEFACQNDLPDCVTKSQDFIEDFKDEQKASSIPQSQLLTICCTALKHGSINEYNVIHDLYLKQINTNSSLKESLFQCLSCTKEAHLLSSYLNDNLKSGIDRDILIGIKNVASKSYGNVIALDFIKNNWDQLLNRFSTSGGFLVVLNELINEFSSEANLLDVTFLAR